MLKKIMMKITTLEATINDMQQLLSSKGYEIRAHNTYIKCI